MNPVIAIRKIYFFLAILLAPIFIFAQAGETAVVLPFENHSPAPGLDWIGEAFPEILTQRLVAPNLLLVRRSDRLYAFDRLGLPANARLSRATIYRMAEQMDVDYVVLGWFGYDGQTFSAHAQLLDMRTLRLSPEQVESGALPSLIQTMTALAWDVQRQITPNLMTSRNSFVAAWPAIRLDAFEAYVRGIVSSSRAEKLERLKTAVRLSPNFATAALELGRTQIEQRDYPGAVNTLMRVAPSDPAGSEAQFYLGLAAFYAGNFEKSEAAFQAVNAQVPLAEVSNDLGVASARRGKKNAADYFAQAADADPSDGDYHFNLGVALFRNGDKVEAAKHLRQAIALLSGDAEAKSLLEAIALNQQPARLPLERIKTNYDESTFRQVAWEIRQVNEQMLATADPATHARFHLNRGQQMLADGLSREAEQEFRECLQYDARNAGAQLGLAQALERQENAAPTVVRAAALAALRLKPSADAYVVLAHVNLRENKQDAARQDLEQALKLDATHADANRMKKALESKAASKTVSHP